MDGQMSTKFDPRVAVGRDYREGTTMMVKQLGRQRQRETYRRFR